MKRIYKCLERGGPCRHTTNIEHAINFKRMHDTDIFYEVKVVPNETK